MERGEGVDMDDEADMEDAEDAEAGDAGDLAGDNGEGDGEGVADGVLPTCECMNESKCEKTLISNDQAAAAGDTFAPDVDAPLEVAVAACASLVLLLICALRIRDERKGLV